MEGESSVNDRCLNMFFYALKLISDNNIEEADKVLHYLEAKYYMSYIFMKYAIKEILSNYYNFLKSYIEQGLI